MTSRLTLKRAQHVPFEDDIDMLGPLLYMIVDFFESTSCTEITMNEISFMAKKLDCNTHTSVIRKVLIQKGFLTGTMWSFKLAITSENKKAMELFFMNHTKLFQSSYMTQKDWAHIYGASGIQGTEVETLLAQVMGPLAALMEHFGHIEKLQSNHEANYAKRVADVLFGKLQIHADGVLVGERLEVLNHAYEVYGPGSIECEEAVERHKKAEDALRVSTAKEEEFGKLCAVVARDGKILALLKEMQALLKEASSTLSKKEREI